MENFIKCILFITLTSITAQSKANQAYHEFSIGNNIRVAVAKKGKIHRIGNAILVKTAIISESLSWTSWTLAACDKSWISTDINLALNRNKTAENFSQLLFDEKSEKIHTETIRIAPVETEKKQGVVKNWIIQNAPYLCKTAKNNMRNLLIPITKSLNSKEGNGLLSSILPETILLEGGIVSAWFRNSYYYSTPLYKSSGEQVEIDGNIIFDEEVSDKYYMEKLNFNCRKKLLAISNSIEYEKEGSEVKSSFTEEKKPTFSAIIPGSIGEAQLEFVCLLYEKK